MYGNAFRSPELHRSTVASTLHQPALWGVLLNVFVSGVTDQSVSSGSEGHKTWRNKLIRSRALAYFTQCGSISATTLCPSSPTATPRGFLRSLMMLVGVVVTTATVKGEVKSLARGGGGGRGGNMTFISPLFPW